MGDYNPYSGASRSGNLNDWRSFQDWFEILNSINKGVALTPEYYGAKNDGTTPDDAAFDLAYADIMSKPYGGTLNLQPGAGYRLSAAHTIYPTVNLRLAWVHGATVLCDLPGAGANLFSGTHPTVPNTRPTGYLQIVNPNIQPHSNLGAGTVGACYLEVRYATGFSLTGNGIFSHYRNNTALRITAAWNCLIGNLQVFGGGAGGFVRKSTAVTFAVTAGSTALVASAAVFDATDAGRILILFGTNAEMVTISGVPADSTHATLASPAVLTHTVSVGGFDAIKVATAAGSPIITLESDVAVTANIGHTVYILDGKNLTVPTRVGLLRAKITAVSGTTVTLDTNVDNTMASTYMAVSAAIELNSESDSPTNDLKVQSLASQKPIGAALVVDGGTDIFFNQLKVHPNLGLATNARTTFGPIFNNCDVSVAQAEFEGSAHNSLAKVICSGLYTKLSIQNHIGSLPIGQALVHGRGLASGAVVEVISPNLSNAGHPAADIKNLVTTDGSGRVVLLNPSANGLAYRPVDFSGGMVLTKVNEDAVGGFHNRIINGALDIWQRGPGTFTQTGAGSQYTADGIKLVGAVGGVHTVTRNAFTLGQILVPGNPQYYLTLADTTPALFPSLRVHVESVMRFQNGRCILSFGAWCASGTVALSARIAQNFGTGGSPSTAVVSAAQNFTLTTTAQPFEFIFDVPSITGKSLGTNDNDHIYFELFPTASGGAFNGNFANFQAEKAEALQSVSSTFEGRPRGVALAECQRYFERFGGLLADTHLANGRAGTTSVAYANMFFRKKRSLPTVTVTGTIATDFEVGYANTVTALTALSAGQIGPESAQLSATTSATPLTQGQSVDLKTKTTSGFIDISAEF